MLARAVKPRLLLLSRLNRVALMQSLFRSTTKTPSEPFYKLVNKSKENMENVSKQLTAETMRRYCSTGIDPFENLDDEDDEGHKSRPLESDDDDENDGTIYLDIEDVQKKHVVVPDVGLCLPLVVTDMKPLFPRFSKIIVLHNPKLIELVRGKVILQQPFVGVFLRKAADSVCEVVDNLEEVHEVGTIASIKTMQDFGHCLRLVVKAQQRVKLKGASVLNDSNIIENSLQTGRRSRVGSNMRRIRFNYKKTAKFHERILNTQANSGEILLVKVKQIKVERTNLTKELKDLKWEIIAAIKETAFVSAAHRKLIETAIEKTNLMKIMSYLSDFGASISGAEPEELQQVMSEMNVPKRMQLCLNLLKRQLNVNKLQKQIAQKVETNVVNDHRKAILEEKLKEVIEELGISSEDSSMIAARFEERLKEKCVPQNVQAIIKEELLRLRFLDSRTEAFSSVRNYLDWLTLMPWGVVSTENFNLEQAAKVLDEEHYGMEHVKRRILEFIAASHLRGDSKGSILCLHGPPGVGKTSIASSIARALNRKFFNFSVGGLIDQAEIKGHRRTYLGAMPGKVVQCLKKTKTENPLILIDEIDKIGGGRRVAGGGEAALAMLELLDPEQNKTFLDHFIDVPVDLSRVFFVCTANQPDLIPSPLRDRMELLAVGGFTDDEKQKVATKYLLPKILKECGLKEEQFKMTETALETLISSYCRESGVRKLQQKIEKIVRKVALKLVRGEVNNFTVTKENLESFIGKLPYNNDRLYQQTPAGVVMSLACSTLGGMALYIETTKRRLLRTENPNSKNTTSSSYNCGLRLTGNLGNVMEESAEIALTVARNFVATRFHDNNSLEEQELHLNVPSGSVHKDGASAGLSISTALVSLAIDRAVPQNIALTGEISLTGKVLPTQDIKEKVIAARRNGVNCLILPKDNLKDYEELPAYIKEGMQAHFVSCFEDVYRTVFEK